MDPSYFRERIETELREVTESLNQSVTQLSQGRDLEYGAGDLGDQAQPVAAAVTGDVVTHTLHHRLQVLERALKRLDDGTYGVSVRSGDRIPRERLEADPAAELTVEEARKDPRI